MTRIVGSGRASLGTGTPLPARPGRRAVRHLPGRGRNRRALDVPAAGCGFAARLAAPEIAGQDGLAQVQRQPGPGPDAAPRGDRWRARHLRRRFPDHAGLSHGRRRPDAARAAHAGRREALPRSAARAARDGRRRPARLRRGGHRARLRRHAPTRTRAVSAPALALSFFDLAHDIHGTTRSGASVLFEGRKPVALPEGPTIEPSGDGWRAELPGTLSLAVEPVSDPGELGGVRARVVRVRGTAAGRQVDGLGTLSETTVPPRWDELDAIRSISALVDEQHALLAVARRPRGAVGHGHELVRAQLVEDGALLAVEDARISTVYDGGGRQRSAGLELWMPGEEFPRRGSGLVIAGSSLDLDGLQVHVAVFRWRLDGREAVGSYELMLRSEPPAAA